MLVCLHMYKRPELLWTPGSSQMRLRSLRWIFFFFFFEVRLLYTTQGDPVPVVLISQLSTPLGDKWSETVAHIWKSPKPVSHQCYQRASTGASSSLNMCVQFMGRYVFLMPWKKHYSSDDGVGMPTWAGGSHAAALCLFFRSTLSS